MRESRLLDLLHVIEQEGQAPSDMTKEEANYCIAQGLMERPAETEGMTIREIVPGHMPIDVEEVWYLLRLTTRGEKRSCGATKEE